MNFIIDSEFQRISTCPNALGYKLQILCSVMPDAVSRKGVFIVLNFSKSENFLGMYVIQFCKITDIGKLIKIELIF